MSGSIFFDPDHLQTADFKIDVNANSINTDNNARDTHLKKEEYFDADRFPLIHFTTSRIESATAAGYLLYGTLFIKGISKQIVIPFTLKQRGEDYLFTGEFMLNRRDFNVGRGSLVLSDNLSVKLFVLGRKMGK